MREVEKKNKVSLEERIEELEKKQIKNEYLIETMSTTMDIISERLNCQKLMIDNLTIIVEIMRKYM